MVVNDISLDLWGTCPTTKVVMSNQLACETYVVKSWSLNREEVVLTHM